MTSPRTTARAALVSGSRMVGPPLDGRYDRGEPRLDARLGSTHPERRRDVRPAVGEPGRRRRHEADAPEAPPPRHHFCPSNKNSPSIPQHSSRPVRHQIILLRRTQASPPANMREFLDGAANSARVGPAFDARARHQLPEPCPTPGQLKAKHAQHTPSNAATPTRNQGLSSLAIRSYPFSR